jgi:hypothetical protein
MVKLTKGSLMCLASRGMIDEGSGSHAFLVPPSNPLQVWALFWFEVFLVGGVDGMVEGLKASPQPSFPHFEWSGTVRDVLRISHRADLPRQGVAVQLGHLDASGVG